MRVGVLSQEDSTTWIDQHIYVLVFFAFRKCILNVHQTFSLKRDLDLSFNMYGRIIQPWEEWRAITTFDIPVYSDLAGDDQQHISGMKNNSTGESSN